MRIKLTYFYFTVNTFLSTSTQNLRKINALKKQIKINFKNVKAAKRI